MLHINTIPLTKDDNHIDYWAKFELENEQIKCVFVNDGKEFYKVSNIAYPYGIIGMIAKLTNNKDAESEASRIIEKANKSAHSKLKGLHVVHSEYHHSITES